MKANPSPSVFSLLILALVLFIFFNLYLFPSPPDVDQMSAQKAAVAEDEVARFSPVDYAVFILMLMMSLGIGLYSAFRSRGNASTQQFLLGGRNMPSLPVATSLVGGILSVVSMLGE